MIPLEELHLIFPLLTIGVKTNWQVERNGGVTSHQLKVFYQAVRSFYVQATDYALQNLPMKDEILKNAKFANVPQREQAYFSQVECFVQKYPNLLPYTSPNAFEELEEEFLDYQLMLTAEIPDDVWKSAIIMEDKEKETIIYRMDVIWTYLGIAINPDGAIRFPKLSKVARLVLTWPHSNAEEEWVFSMVTKNKTSFRPNLGMAGTLQSINWEIQSNVQNMSHVRKY